MPITSSETNNLIASQMAALQQQQQSAFDARHGLGVANTDGMGSAIPSMAAGVGTYVGNAPNAMGGAVTLAAGFGLLPRALDPFTQSAHVASAAARMGGGWMGGGAMGAIGAGAATFGMYTAAGAAMDYAVLDPFKTGAQMRGMTLGAIHSAMPSAPMSSMAVTAQMMESLQRSSHGRFGLSDQMGLMQMGIAGGAINTGDMSAFQQSFKKLIDDTKQVAQALSSSLSEAYSAMQQIKGLGVSNVPGTALTMRGLGVASGISPAEMMGIATGGSQLAKMAGISRDIGVNGAISSAATFGYLGASKAFGEDFGLQDLSSFQNASYRFFGSNEGTRVLAAMMDKTGKLDPFLASQIASGTMSKREIMRLSNQTLSNRADLFGANNSELVTEFGSLYGPTGFGGALDTMTRDSTNPNSHRARLTGLNNEQMGQMATMRNMGSNIQSNIANEASTAFNQPGIKLGFKDQLKAAMSKAMGPLQAEAEKYGAELSQKAAEYLDDVTRDFFTRPALGPDFSGAKAINSALSMGNYGKARGILNNLQQYSSSGAEDGIPTNISSSSYLPRVMNSEMSGKSASDLYAQHGIGAYLSNSGSLTRAGVVGLLTNGSVSRGVASGLFGATGHLSETTMAMAEGRGIVGSLFSGVESLGKYGMSGLKATGLTGVGAGRAMANAGVGLGLRAAGLVGKVASGPIGWGLMAYDAASIGNSALESRMVSSGMIDEEYMLGGNINDVAKHLMLSGAINGTEVFSEDGKDGEARNARGVLTLGGSRHVDASSANFAGTGRMRESIIGKEALSKAVLAMSKKNNYQVISSWEKTQDPDKVSSVKAIVNDKSMSSDKRSILLNRLGVHSDVQLAYNYTSGNLGEIGQVTDKSARKALEGLVGSGSVMEDARFVQSNKAAFEESIKEAALSGNKITAAAVADIFAGKVGEGSADSARSAVFALENNGGLGKFGGHIVNNMNRAFKQQNDAQNAKISGQSKEAKELVKIAAVAAGVSSTELEAALAAFSSAEDGVHRSKIVDTAAESLMGLTAEQQAVLVNKLGGMDSAFTQQLAGSLDPRAKLSGALERHMPSGKKVTGKAGRKFLEDYIGGSYGGMGVEDYVSGKSNYVSSKALAQIDSRLEQMLMAKKDGPLSTEDHRTVDILRGKILDAAKGGDLGKKAAVDFMKVMGAMPGTSKPQQGADMQIQYSQFTEAMKKITDYAAKLPDAAK